MIPPACALGLRHLLASAGCRLLPSSAPAWRACLALCSDNLPRAPFGQRGSHAEVRKERLLSSLGRAQREELWVAHACDPPLTERKYGQPARPHRVLRRGPGSADPKTMLSGRGAARAHASRNTAAVAPVASTAALPPRGSRLLKSQRGSHAGGRGTGVRPYEPPYPQRARFTTTRVLASVERARGARHPPQGISVLQRFLRRMRP